MGNPKGFIEIKKLDRTYENPNKRIKHFREFIIPLEKEEVANQGARCMDCGIPYCHQGCPVNNLIPDWNDLVYLNDWKKALETLHLTNNFPEFTGRVCPAPCEEACTLNLTDKPVSIKTIECSIIDYGWKKGWIKPQIAPTKTGKKIAIIGSGPAGLACAQQLAREGHKVIVFEKNDRIGGLLRIGIPDFKMEKHLIDRRVSQMLSEGVEFRTNSEIGKNISLNEVKNSFDAISICIGSEHPRNLSVKGRKLSGIYYAMEFLSQQNDRVADKKIDQKAEIFAKDKKVLVIGGGDTGSDCVGTSNRQGAKSVHQLELLPQPPEKENKLLTWPSWPMKLRTSSSHLEGCDRKWSILTKSFEGEIGIVKKLNCLRIEWKKDSNGKMNMNEVKNSEFSIEADLVLLAMGFEHPTHEGFLKKLEIDLDEKGNIKANDSEYKTSLDKFFVAGDSRRGQSLVVWAIKEGRECAQSINAFLKNKTNLLN